MNTKFTLDYEVVDNIVKASLLELYEELKDTQEKMKADFDNLKDFQIENYKHDKKILEATKILVCYYTSSEERPEELMNFLDSP
jgi:predicted nucleic acid-binding protein